MFVPFWKLKAWPVRKSANEDPVAEPLNVKFMKTEAEYELIHEDEAVPPTAI